MHLENPRKSIFLWNKKLEQKAYKRKPDEREDVIH